MFVRDVSGETAAGQDKIGGAADVDSDAPARRRPFAGRDRLAHVGVTFDRMPFRQRFRIGAQIEIDHGSGLERERPWISTRIGECAAS